MDDEDKSRSRLEIRSARRADSRRRAVPMSALQLISEHACFGGVQRFFEHASQEIGLPMRFSLYLPPQAAESRVPAVVYLAGLTCNEETFATKAGAQRVAAELGLALIAPDTSPRGAGVPGESEAWDFGAGASFYLDATEAPWAAHYRMESYLVKELIRVVALEQPIATSRVGIFGHSMGGHGALTLALRHPALFKSVSALAPICAPTQCLWGQKAFAGYLGPDTSRWAEHDASALMGQRAKPLCAATILIDQGLADKFLAMQLHPHLFEQACAKAQQALTLRRHAAYDHGYYFVSTFVAEHLAHHAEILC